MGGGGGFKISLSCCSASACLMVRGGRSAFRGAPMDDCSSSESSCVVVVVERSLVASLIVMPNSRLPPSLLLLSLEVDFRAFGSAYNLKPPSSSHSNGGYNYIWSTLKNI